VIGKGIGLNLGLAGLIRREEQSRPHIFFACDGTNSDRQSSVLFNGAWRGRWFT
jgi:hypothetical protein